MGTWLDRYRGGECGEVWAEMESLGADLRKPAYRKESSAVVRETIGRANQNVLTLFAELLKLGYQFGGGESAEPDHPLEVRLEHALEYVKQHGTPKHKADPWRHPALAWVEDEEIDVPARFRKGKPGRTNFRAPSERTKASLDQMEPLPLAVRAWFEKVGSVDFQGRHPVLNREGAIVTLRVIVEQAFQWTGVAGSEFVSHVRRGFQWGGLPGWSERAAYPEREIESICAVSSGCVRAGLSMSSGARVRAVCIATASPSHRIPKSARQ